MRLTPFAITLYLASCTGPSTGDDSATRPYAPEPGSLSFHNPDHDLQGTLADDGGFTITNGSSALTLRTARWGRPDHLTEAAPASVGLGQCAPEHPLSAPAACRQPLQTVHDGLVAWWANDTSGLQQGWTVSHSPDGSGPLVLDVTVDDATWLVKTPTEASLHPMDGPSLRYAGLLAWDADHRPLAAHLSTWDSGLRITIDDAGARYPLTVDPTISGGYWDAFGGQADAHFGESAVSAGDVDGDGYDDVIIGAPDHDNTGTDEGAAYLFLGSETGLADTPAWTLLGTLDNAHLGQAVASAGDVNGDGYDDVLIGIPNHDDDQANEGRVELYLGSPAGLGASPAWSVDGDLDGAQLGHALAGAGDVDGDGFDDVILGAWRYDGAHPDGGRSVVYLGSAAGLRATPIWAVEGTAPNARLGAQVASAGDVNGDGFDDVVLGVERSNDTLTNEGAVFVYLGSSSGPGTTAAWITYGGQAGARYGSGAASAGDVNDDGYDDLIVGARWYDDGENGEGRAYVYLGSPTGLDATPVWTAQINQADANFGTAVASAGDVDSDGHDDVLVAAPLYDGTTDPDGGRVYLYLGTDGGVAATAHSTLRTNQAGAEYGRAIASAGDVNGDWHDDVISGAHLEDDLLTDEGRALLHIGGPSVLRDTTHRVDHPGDEVKLCGGTYRDAWGGGSVGYDDAGTRTTLCPSERFLADSGYRMPVLEATFAFVDFDGNFVTAQWKRARPDVFPRTVNPTNTMQSIADDETIWGTDQAPCLSFYFQRTRPPDPPYPSAGRGWQAEIRCIEGDQDDDGVGIDADNCVDVANPDQADIDNDDVGDACDLCTGTDASGDTDGDTICDLEDTCPNIPNLDHQDDADADGIGDLCDACFGVDASGDTDGDGYCDDGDVCPALSNADDQTDTDGDGIGDLCDACFGDNATGDTDGDGFCDDVDNCVATSNADQADLDLDLVGDACDADHTTYQQRDGVVTACVGTFHDSGGPTANYSSNEHTTLTFCPDLAGHAVELTFTAFNVRNSDPQPGVPTSGEHQLAAAHAGPTAPYPGCNTPCNDCSKGQFCDDLGWVVAGSGHNNGPDGEWWGTNSPGTVTGDIDLGGCLSFTFNSNGISSRAGWAASLTCVQQDLDGDGVGNADPCPNDPGNDSDGDGVCDGVDVCASRPDTATDAGSTIGPLGTIDLCIASDDVPADTCLAASVSDASFTWTAPADATYRFTTSGGTDHALSVGTEADCGATVLSCDAGNTGLTPGVVELAVAAGETLRVVASKSTQDACSPVTVEVASCTDADGDGSCDCTGASASGDTDGDGVCDDLDTCLGDDATGDTDGDAVCDDLDVCPLLSDPNDTDGDGVCDAADACTGDDGAGDLDGDGVCNDLDDDDDGDGATDDVDPCPVDIVDDPDGDGVCTADDRCPSTPDAAACPNLAYAWDASQDTQDSTLWSEITGTVAPSDWTFAVAPVHEAVTSAHPGIHHALRFTGAEIGRLSSNARFSDLPNFSNQSASVELWFAVDGIGAGPQVLWETGDASNGLSILIDGGDVVAAHNETTVLRASMSHGGMQDFMYVALVLDTEGDTLSLYLNGQLANEAIDTANSWSGNNHTGLAGIAATLGGLSDGSLGTVTGFEGHIARMEVHGTARSSAEISGTWGVMTCGPHADSDGDGSCDTIDTDRDGDGVVNPIDGCTTFGDSDSDSDGICDSDETCPGRRDGEGCADVLFAWNASQDRNGDDQWNDLFIPGGTHDWTLSPALHHTLLTEHTGLTHAFAFPALSTSQLGLTTFEDHVPDITSSSVSFEIWARVQDPDAVGEEILFESGGASSGLSIYLRNGRVGAKLSGSPAIASAPLGLALDDFIQVVVVYDHNTSLSLYVGGQQVDSVAGTSGRWSGANPAGLGGSNSSIGGSDDGSLDAYTGFRGDLALVTIDGRARTATEIASSYFAIHCGPYDPDQDGICTDDDLCQGDNATGDADGDGVCDDLDACAGDDLLGDTDGDGICDDIDACEGDDATGDTDADGLCDALDTCTGDDRYGDADGDGTCDDLDPCPVDPLDDSDGDGICDGIDRCLGDDASGDLDDDATCDDLDDDDDDDGTLDVADVCPRTAIDDYDGDGVCEDIDTCPRMDDSVGCDNLVFAWDASLDAHDPSRWDERTGVYADADWLLDPGTVRQPSITSFDGITHELLFPAADVAVLSGPQFVDLGVTETATTFEIWFRDDDPTSTAQRVLWESGGAGVGLSMVLTDTDLEVHFAGAAPLSAPLTAAQRTDFVQAVLVWSRWIDTIDLYIDGVLIGSAATTGAAWSGANAAGLGGTAGGQPGGNDDGSLDTAQGFHGAIAAFNIWSIARAPGLIEDAYTSMQCGNLDTDADGVCDFFDPCPADPYDDLDGDGICGDLDTCPGRDDATCSGLVLAWDAAYDLDNDTLWEETTGTWPDVTWDVSTATREPVTSARAGITEAYAFTGAGATLQPTSLQTLSTDLTSDPMTVELWARVADPATAGQEVLWESGGTVNGLSLLLDGDSVRLSLAGTPQLTATLTPAQLSDFIQLVGVYDEAPDELHLYVDGTLVASTTHSRPQWQGSDPAGLAGIAGTLGGNDAGQLDAFGPFTGDIAAVHLYNEARTAAQIEAAWIATHCGSLDADSDLDRRCDDVDLCPLDPDNDIDGDGVCGDIDPCPLDLLDDSDGDGSCDSDDLCEGNDQIGDLDNDGLCDDIDPCPADRTNDSDNDGVCDSSDLCLGDDAVGDTDSDGVCDDLDPCPLDPADDSDGDGSCDLADLCLGDDATGDSDGDMICDDLDVCFGDDGSGDTDGDGVCDDLDLCPADPNDDSDGDGTCDSVDLCIGDDATTDTDADGTCDDLDPCPLDPADDSDGDGSCDLVDLCLGDDSTGDVDGDGVCGNLDPCPTTSLSPDPVGTCPGSPSDADGDGCADPLDGDPAVAGDLLLDAGTEVVLGGPRVDLVDVDGRAAVLARAGSTSLLAARYDGAAWTVSNLTIASAVDSVAISGDTVLVGGGNQATLFAYDGAAWVPAGTLVPDVAGNGYGASVAIDGDRAFVATAYDDVPGAVRVFERTNGTWAQTHILQVLIDEPTSDTGFFDDPDGFGTSLSTDGDRLLVGAPRSDLQGPSHGAAFVFERQPDGSWARTADLAEPASEPLARFGARVLLRGDHAFVTRMHAFDGTPGRVHHFTRAPSGTWDLVRTFDDPEARTGEPGFGTAGMAFGGNALWIRSRDLHLFRIEDGTHLQTFVPSPRPSGYGEIGVVDDQLLFTGLGNGALMATISGTVVLEDADADGRSDVCTCTHPDADGDRVCDADDTCAGDDATGDIDGDGVCSDVDPCPLDLADDSDGDGSCDSVDLCIGDDATGDGDSDGICDDTDLCIGGDATGDSDSDGVCDDTDLCIGNDAEGDPDGNGYCEPTLASQGTPAAGQTVQLRLANAPAGVRAYFLLSTQGVSGPIACHPVAVDACTRLSNRIILGSSTVGASGAATFQLTIPGGVPAGSTAYLHAAWVDGAQGVGDSTNELVLVTQ